MREALACSYNIPAVQAAQDFGVSKLLKLLHAAGFISLNKTTQDYGLGLALGNGEVTLLELANAYRAVANNGLWTPLVFATQPQLKQQGRPAQFITPQTAFIITDILADNKARAAAFGLNSPLALPFAFAAKTGTSKDYRDNWAIGYNPRFTIAVWTGNFNGAPMRRVSGITGAAPLLRDIAMFLQQHYPAEIQNNKTSFIKPAGIVEETICLHTGLKAGKDCKHTAMEFYLEEYKPAAVCAACAASVSPQPAAQKTGGIIFPQDGDVFMVDPALPPAAQQIALKAAQPGVWKINGATLPCKETKCFWPLQPGDIELIHTPPGGKQSKINFTVL